MSDAKIARLRQIVETITTPGADWDRRVCNEMTMRIPAEPDRDADLVLSWAADEIERLRGEVKDLRAENERWHNAAITAEKWRGIALARGGDGRTLAEMEREKQDAVEAERQRARMPEELFKRVVDLECSDLERSPWINETQRLLRDILAWHDRQGEAQG